MQVSALVVTQKIVNVTQDFALLVTHKGETLKKGSLELHQYFTIVTQRVKAVKEETLSYIKTLLQILYLKKGRQWRENTLVVSRLYYCSTSNREGIEGRKLLSHQMFAILVTQKGKLVKEQNCSHVKCLLLLYL